MKQIRSRLAFAAFRFVYLPLMGVALRVEGSIVDFAATNRALLLQYLGIMIRDTDILSDLDEEVFDLMVFSASLKMLLPELFSEDYEYRGLAEAFIAEESLIQARNKVQEDSQTIDSIVARVVDQKEVSECRCQFWLLLHTIYRLKNSKYADYNLARAQKLDDSVKPLTITRLIAIRRNTKRYINRIKEKVVYRESTKLDINISQVLGLSAFVTALFLPAGYLYNYFLLGDLGISIGDYFTMADYLSSSIKAVHASVLSVIWFLGVTALSLPYYISESNAQNILKSRYRILIPRPFIFRFYWHIMLSILATSISISYITNSRSLYIRIGLFVLTIITILCDRLSFRYFRNPVIIRTAIIAVVIAIFSLWSTAKNRAYDLRNGIEHDRIAYHIHFEQGHSLPSSDLVVLASTTNYLILTTRELKTYVIRRDLIKYIEFNAD